MFDYQRRDKRAQSIQRPAERSDLLDQTRAGEREGFTRDDEDRFNVSHLAVGDGELAFGGQVGDIADTAQNGRRVDMLGEIDGKSAVVLHLHRSAVGV